MSKKFLVTDIFKGYRTKKDDTKLESGYLVNGSQNVISTDGDNIKIRPGYTRYGQIASGTDPIVSSFDWDTNTGIQRNLRSSGDILSFYSSDTEEWEEILSELENVNINFDYWWDADQDRDILLFVNGGTGIYSWSGGTAKMGATTASTIQLLDTDSTWVEDRFLQNGAFTVTYDKKITINGTEYTYTGGETTNTLTGVTPDPTGEASGSLAVQTVTEHTDTPGSDDVLFPNELISVLKNQVWIGSTINNNVFVSKNTDFTSFSFSSPRVPGEGALLTFDGPLVGFIPQEEDMYASAGKSQWYQSRFTLSDDNTAETLNIERLKTGAQQAALSQASIAKSKNRVIFMSNEPTLDTLGRIENVDSPQAKPISDPIKPDFDNANLTGVHVKYFRNGIYVAVPAEGKVYIFNLQKNFWEPPQLLPVSRLAIIGGELYGHSSAVDETYKLFTELSDNDNPINAIAKFSYQNFGDRVAIKNFDELYSEGKISSNTKVTVAVNYEYQGSEAKKEFTIDGSDTDIIFESTNDNSIGKNPLGEEPLGSTTVETASLAKFRIIHEVKKIDFFEKQVIYSTNEADQQWEILAYGCNAQHATSIPIKIKK